MNNARERFDRLPAIDSIQVGRPRLRLNNPVLAGGGEVLDWSLYDFFSVAVDTLFDVVQQLFTTPTGQFYTPVGGTAFSKTLLHTNIQGGGGQLPNGYKLDVQAIRLVVDSAIQHIDLQNLLYNTFGNFIIGQKSYWQGPLDEIPGGVGENLSFQTTGNGPANTNGPANLRAVYSLSAGLEANITYGQNFAFYVNPTLGEAGSWTTQADSTTPPGVGLRAWIHLDGVFTRPTQ
jgi:hypothetical protein